MPILINKVHVGKCSPCSPSCQPVSKAGRAGRHLSLPVTSLHPKISPASTLSAIFIVAIHLTICKNCCSGKTMPSPRVYQVATRYTSENALEKKLRRIFPSSRASDFKIKVCCKMSSRSSCRCTDESVNRW